MKILILTSISIPSTWKSSGYNLTAIDINSLNVLQLQNPGPFRRKLVLRDGRKNDNQATFITNWFQANFPS